MIPARSAFVSGFGVNSLFLGNFESAYGTPTDTPSRGSACAYHLGGYMTNQNGPDNVPEIEKVEYILNIGRTLGPNIAVSSVGTRHTMDALLNRGIKIVNVDPRCGPEASKMDWVPIRTGTELAFMLGILHTILYEVKTYDVWFVKNRTNGPYLIGPTANTSAIQYLKNRSCGTPRRGNRSHLMTTIPPISPWKGCTMPMASWLIQPSN